MYRVNAERSQEKNDGIDEEEDGTKVTSIAPTKNSIPSMNEKTILRVRLAEFFLLYRRRAALQREKKEMPLMKRSPFIRTLYNWTRISIDPS
jgi:hypothetical protein